MEKKEETVLLYNVDEQEKQQLASIFKDLGMKIEFQETSEEDDILAFTALFTFIKRPNNKEKLEKINEIIDVLRGWTINFFIEDNFFVDIEKVKRTIQDYYEESQNLKIMYECNQNFIKDGIIGFAIGDALGVPAEFKTRQQLNNNPIKDMMGYGTYNMPKGTWSDDTSMTLAIMDSIIKTKNIDTNDIALKFIQWFRKGKYTATGETFDIGRTTMQSLAKFELGIEKAENCGQDGEMDNGNGALMRMLPIAYYIWFLKYNSKLEISNKEIYEIVKRVCSITHRHETNIMGCYIFLQYALEIMDGKYKYMAHEYIKNIDYSFFSSETIRKYNKILKSDIKEQSIDNINSTGYIVDTLEAVFWLFLNSKDYNTTILKAVNMGNDTDTIAAITGGLLGIHYGEEKIKDEWKKALLKYDYIEGLCNEFYNAMLCQ